MLQKRQIRTDEPEIGRFGTRDSGDRIRDFGKERCRMRAKVHSMVSCIFSYYQLKYKRNETILENGHCLFVIYKLPGEFCWQEIVISITFLLVIMDTNKRKIDIFILKFHSKGQSGEYSASTTYMCYK